jgi:hypothetical protein
MTASVHLRGIVIAGALAVLALGLGFMTLSMNRTAAPAAPHTILPLKLRHHATTTGAKAATTVAKHTVAARKTVKPKPKPKWRDNPNYIAAKKAGLPASLAFALALRPVAVVTFTSKDDAVAQLAAREAVTGAIFAGAAFVVIGVDRDGGAVEKLTRLLGTLPSSPATLVYKRPATLVSTLPGFNDRTVVQQAATSAATPSTSATPSTPSTSAS